MVLWSFKLLLTLIIITRVVDGVLTVVQTNQAVGQHLAGTGTTLFVTVVISSGIRGYTAHFVGGRTDNSLM